MSWNPECPKQSCGFAGPELHDSNCADTSGGERWSQTLKHWHFTPTLDCIRVRSDDDLFLQVASARRPSSKLVKTSPRRYTLVVEGMIFAATSYGYHALTALVTGFQSTALVEGTCWRRIT